MTAGRLKGTSAHDVAGMAGIGKHLRMSPSEVTEPTILDDLGKDDQIDGASGGSTIVRI